MVRARYTLAIVALGTSLISCTNQGVPATTPSREAQTLRIYATTATTPLVIDLTYLYNQSHPFITFDTWQGSDSITHQALVEGELSYLITNHLPSGEDGLWAAPIGWDGIAIIVHPSTAVENLTTIQLRAIYQGQINNWAEVGSTTSQPIVVFTRESGSGTRAEFNRMIMGNRATTSKALVTSSSSLMVENVAQTPGGIGFVSIAHLDDSVSTLSVEGIQPTQANIASNRYPLRSALFVVGQAEPEGEYRLFVDWIQSQSGQAIVSRWHTALLTQN